MTEPIADKTRSILDGHIILSRKLATANHYPTIDVLASVSRVMNAIVSKEHREMAGKVRALMAKYEEVALLVQIGEYKKGSDAAADEAIAKIDAINAYLCQGLSERADFEQALQGLRELTG